MSCYALGMVCSTALPRGSSAAPSLGEQQTVQLSTAAHVWDDFQSVRLWKSSPEMSAIVQPFPEAISALPVVGSTMPDASVCSEGDSLLTET